PAGICGVVAQMVEVPQEYERAVAAVLRDKLEYVVVSRIEDGLSAVEHLHGTQAGHGSFIPLQPRATNGSTHGNHDTDGHRAAGAGTAPLLDFLIVDQRYHQVAQHSLGDTQLVPYLPADLRHWA